MRDVFLYSLRDKTAKDCGPVFDATNDETAIRKVKSSVKDPSIPIEEFELYRIAEFIQNDEGMPLIKSSESVLIYDFAEAKEITQEDMRKHEQDL